jgi:hypothetical protein
MKATLGGLNRVLGLGARPAARSGQGKQIPRPGWPVRRGVRRLFEQTGYALQMLTRK